jgi:MFS family permease
MNSTEDKNIPWWKENTQPFVDMWNASRALWGINIANTLEGLVYFGFLGYFAIYFSEFVFKGVTNPNEHAHDMVMVLTAGITLSMLLLGHVVDKKGIRFTLITSFIFMIMGRVTISAAPTIMEMKPDGLWSTLHITTMVGIFFVIIGYGLFQPGSYASVRKFTTEQTSAAAFAMLYALMNLGGWFPTFAFLLRDEKFLNLGIPGTFWVYTGITVVALMLTMLILDKKTVADALAKIETEKAQEKTEAPAKTTKAKMNILGWLKTHPLADIKFTFFIFCLIPVQTLFTYNWLVLPAYVERSYTGWVGEYFEIASNANPILIFLLCPIIASLTQKRSIYAMMVAGTFVMASPAFLLAIGPYTWTLAGYILLMTIGEAMWQPRFLQYAAQIAPKDRIGQYMGVSQLPWFLTKVLVPFLYSGKMVDAYCPKNGPKDTQTMWLIFGCIAIMSTVMLVLARKWLGKSIESKTA